MDKEQFFNAVRQQDLHILDVSSNPPDKLVKLVRESEYKDHLFAKVHSERFGENVYVALGFPYVLEPALMGKGMVRNVAVLLMRELARVETERAENESRSA